MANPDVINFTDQNFQAEVLDSNQPVLVDFWAVWCMPCRAIAPVIDELATEYKGKARIGKLNVDENQAVAAKFGIRSIPTLLVFKGGKVVDQIVGVQPKAKLAAAIDGAL
jgi:thioredoxin 1